MREIFQSLVMTMVVLTMAVIIMPSCQHSDEPDSPVTNNKDYEILDMDLGSSTDDLITLD